MLIVGVMAMRGSELREKAFLTNVTGFDFLALFVQIFVGSQGRVLF